MSRRLPIPVSPVFNADWRTRGPERTSLGDQRLPYFESHS